MANYIDEDMIDGNMHMNCINKILRKMQYFRSVQYHRKNKKKQQLIHDRKNYQRKNDCHNTTTPKPTSKQNRQKNKSDMNDQQRLDIEHEHLFQSYENKSIQFNNFLFYYPNYINISSDHTTSLHSNIYLREDLYKNIPGGGERIFLQCDHNISYMDEFGWEIIE
jgi:hypothetical protein